jgi:DNA-directed RNA polymerase specialized sigma24 family protein
MPETNARALLQAAFRDLHGARLHGFALLVALGDRAAAATAATEALAEGAQRLTELRHPERAAAWLRGRVRCALARGHRPAGGEEERRHALRALGVTDFVFDGLAALSLRERAAFVAATIEQLETIDVETVMGGGAGQVQRAVDRARRAYLAGAVRGLEGTQSPLPVEVTSLGSLATRIHDAASRTGLGVSS